MRICWKHEEECESRASLMKQSKRFSAKEHVRGHTASFLPPWSLGLGTVDTITKHSAFCLRGLIV